MQVKVDGQSIGKLGPDGLDLPSLTAGNHQLDLGEGKDARRKSIDIGPARTLVARLDADPNAGNLVVQTNEDDVEIVVLLNGQEIKRGVTKNRGFSVQGLRAETYQVRVSKGGYDVDAGEKPVLIEKGQDVQVSFEFRRRPVMASVEIHSTAGAELFMDGARLAVVPSSGVFLARDRTGKHTFQAKKKQFKPRQQDVELLDGENRPIDLTLAPALGTVEVKVTPSDSAITYDAADGPSRQGFKGPKQQLPEGEYTFYFQANGFEEESRPVHVTADKNETISLALSPKKPAVPEKVDPMAAWGKDVWKKASDGWFLHAGGNFVAFPHNPAGGAIQFTVRWEVDRGRISRVLKGKGSVQWCLEHLDNDTYLLFQLSEGSLQGSRVTKKQKSSLNKTSLDKAASYTVRIETRPDRIIHKIKNGNTWQTVDTPSPSGSDFGQGKFGFLIPVNQEIMLRDFSFEPQ